MDGSDSSQLTNCIRGSEFRFQRIWLQTHFEIVEDRLLIHFRGGDFLELHSIPSSKQKRKRGYLALRLESDTRTLRTTSLTRATVHGFGIESSKPYLRKSDRTGASE